MLTTIRAVVDATGDISYQEATKLARVADETGHRTVAVVSKYDLVPIDARRDVSLRLFNQHRLVD